SAGPAPAAGGLRGDREQGLPDHGIAHDTLAAPLQHGSVEPFKRAFQCRARPEPQLTLAGGVPAAEDPRHHRIDPAAGGAGAVKRLEMALDSPAKDGGMAAAGEQAAIETGEGVDLA